MVAEAVGGEPQCRAAVAALVPRGLAEVRSHRRSGPGKPSFLTRDEEKQVVAEAATGVLATAQAVRDWIEDRFGVLYTVGSLSTLLPRLGLWNAARRVWAPRGVEVSREAQINRQYTYVAVALNPLTGDLWWAWQANMKGEERARIQGVWAEAPAIDGWVWDGASGHKGADMQAIAAPRVVQPSYAPEPNPVERFFQELRRALGDSVYPTLEAKKAALEPIPRAWQADPERVRQLCSRG